MKLLTFLQGREASDQIGYHESSIRLVKEGALTGYISIPYLTSCASLPFTAYKKGIAKAKEYRPDLIFFQFFHASFIPDPQNFFQELRKIVPKAVFFVSAGDSFGRWTRKFPQSLIAASKASDLTFLTGMGGMADNLIKKGGKRIVLMPHGFCPIRFPAFEQDIRSTEYEWDVVCVANNYRTRNPFSYIYKYKIERISEINALAKRYGKKFAIFGRGWNGLKNWQGELPFEKQGEVYKKSAVIVGGRPGGGMDYYLSDREFIALACGGKFVEFWTPRVEKIFQNDFHWYLYKKKSEMLKKIDFLLGSSVKNSDAQRVATQEYVRSKHSQYNRMAEMIRIAKEFLEERSKKYRPKLNFFLPGTNLDIEMRYAIKGWEL